MTNIIFMGSKEWNAYKAKMNTLLNKKALGNFTIEDEKKLERVKSKVYEGFSNSRKYLI